MKYVYLLFCIYLISLTACQKIENHNKKSPIADSAKIAFYQSKINHLQNKEPDSIILYADSGLRLARRIRNPSLEGKMLNNFAQINEQYGNVKLAFKYEQEAYIIFNKIHDKISSADASAKLGILDGKQGNFKRGLHLIKTALKQYEVSHDTMRMIRAYTQLGQINEISGQLPTALKAYRRAEKLNENKPVTGDYLALISSIGGLHNKMGNQQDALDYYEAGINKSTAAKYLKMHIAMLNMAGKAYNKLGNKNRALAYHRLGLQKAQEFGLHEEEARSLIGIAGSLQKQDAELSIRHLKNALQIAHSIGHQQLAAEIYRSLSDVYRQQSHYKDALTSLEEHHRLLDSLLNANKGHKIATLQSSYELAESRLRVEALELTNKQRTFQRNEGMIATAAILIILIIVAFYFYNTRQLNKELTSSNLIKDQLFSIIGHDLRNPIGGITQLLAIMEEDEMTEEHRQILSEMKKQGLVSLEILNALLKWGEMQLKGIPIEPVHFNAKDSINKNKLALHQQALDKSITIKDNTAPEIHLFGDINHFEFVIRNLLSNAIKFSLPSGTIEITSQLHSQSGMMHFLVKDQGKGINKEQQELFKKSNMKISYGTKGEKGTGIGLMLSKKFIAANKGEIWIASIEGEGTTFNFTFPWAYPSIVL